jgi:hypothetical protein
MLIRRITMTRMLVAVGLAVMSLAWAGVTMAGTDQQKWDAAIAKLAVPFESFPNKISKAFCVCNDPSSQNLVGQLETLPGPNGTVAVVCSIYNFSPDGSLLLVSGCSNWTPMSK